MKTLLIALCLLGHVHGAGIVLSSPSNYQVVQRGAGNRGSVTVSGSLLDMSSSSVGIEIRIVRGAEPEEWRPLVPATKDAAFSAPIEVPAGGWYRLEARAMREGQVVAETATENFGVGEVFVVAGQSNSANYGEGKQTPRTGRVVAFDGQRWRPANDPQPVATGEGGSFMPFLGDALVRRFDVPVGFIACGIGATSVREWLPKNVNFPNPPTMMDRIARLPDGSWTSNGEAFAMLVARMRQAGPQHFRAVLWHQGESDANQQDTTRTLPGELYRKYLTTVIEESRRESGFAAPWFVAQASYHVPGDESSPDIRAAQASLWTDGVALQGPDTDALKGDLREAGGQGVHFSAKGLREHAMLWVARISPWLEQQLK